MKFILFFLPFWFVIAGLAATVAQGQAPASPPQDEMARELRRELVLLPSDTVFDNVLADVRGNTAILSGEVIHPSLRTEAENAAKRVHGIASVDDQIEVIPPSPMDDRVRDEVFGAIYEYAGLRKYEFAVRKPIRIIVQDGRVSLYGVVDSDADRNLAGVRARSIPDHVPVTNNLLVAEPRS